MLCHTVTGCIWGPARQGSGGLGPSTCFAAAGGASALSLEDNVDVMMFLVRCCNSILLHAATQSIRCERKSDMQILHILMSHSLWSLTASQPGTKSLSASHLAQVHRVDPSWHSITSLANHGCSTVCCPRPVLMSHCVIPYGVPASH
jgi:hypothetical protein